MKMRKNNIDHDFAVVKDIAIIDNYIYASAIEYVVPKDCVNLSIFRIKFLTGVKCKMEFAD